VFTASDPLRLVAISDRDTIRADDHDLAYITVTLRDDQGNIATHRDRLVHLQVGETPKPSSSSCPASAPSTAH
jgi:hypothetical protein